jgi:hypothetical protein
MACVPAKSDVTEYDTWPWLSNPVANVVPFFFRVTVTVGVPTPEVILRVKTTALPAVNVHSFSLIDSS